MFVVFADSDGAAFLTPEETVGLGGLLRPEETAEIPSRESISADGYLAEFSGAVAHRP